MSKTIVKFKKGRKILSVILVYIMYTLRMDLIRQELIEICYNVKINNNFTPAIDIFRFLYAWISASLKDTECLGLILENRGYCAQMTLCFKSELVQPHR